MKQKLKTLLIAIAVVAFMAVYFGSNYFWPGRIKSKVPIEWVLVYEGKNPSLILPWTWLFPEPTGLWFITSPPKKIDSALAKGQNLVIADVATFHKYNGKTEESDYSVIVSLDQSASHILSDDELQTFLNGQVSQIQFDWKTYKQENAGSAIIEYCSKEAVEAMPELGPHFPTNSFASLGTFFGNSTYVRLPEEGGFLGSTSVGVAAVREKGLLLVNQTGTDQFAILDLSDRKALPGTSSDLKFQKVDESSISKKAWTRATQPESFSSDRIAGKSQGWIHVEMLGEGKKMSRIYVGDKIEKLPDSDLPYVPMLEVSMDFFMVHLKPATKQSAIVQTDFFWVPIEDNGYDDLKWQGIEPGSIGEAVSKLILK